MASRRNKNTLLRPSGHTVGSYEVRAGLGLVKKMPPVNAARTATLGVFTVLITFLSRSSPGVVRDFFYTLNK